MEIYLILLIVLFVFGFSVKQIIKHIEPVGLYSFVSGCCISALIVIITIVLYGN